MIANYLLKNPDDLILLPFIGNIKSVSNTSSGSLRSFNFISPGEVMNYRKSLWLIVSYEGFNMKLSLKTYLISSTILPVVFNLLYYYIELVNISGYRSFI